MWLAANCLYYLRNGTDFFGSQLEVDQTLELQQWHEMVALLSYKTLHTCINCVLFQQCEAFAFIVLLLMAPCSFKGIAVSESIAFNKITIDWWGEEQNNEKMSLDSWCRVILLLLLLMLSGPSCALNVWCQVPHQSSRSCRHLLMP